MFSYPMSRLLEFAVLCVAMQAAFSLPQGIKDESFYVDRKDEKISNPVADEHSMLSSQQVEDSSENAIHNDSGSCFLYFVSQDVNSLLNQARRMLFKSTSDRQRSWLILYVHNLESLSKKLQQLPVENKNRCFQIRERLESETTTSKELSSAPDEVQLRFAKKLFLASQHSPDSYRHNNVRSNEYVTGTISTGPNEDPAVFENGPRMAVDMRKPSQNNEAHIAHQQSNKYIDENAKSSGNLDLLPDISGSSSSDSHLINSKDPDSSASLPITYHDKVNMGFESMPFLPRATRKIVPHAAGEKMKFRALAGRVRTAYIATTEEGKTEVQTRLPYGVQPSNELGEAKVEETTTNIVVPSEKHSSEISRGSSTQQYEESFTQHDNQDVNSAADYDFKTAHLEKTTEYFDENDDLVVQLHSEGKHIISPHEKIHPMLLKDTKPINVKVLPSMVPSEPSATSPEIKIKEVELPRVEEPLEKTEKADYDSITGMFNNHDISGAIPVQNENNLDFDYEEQGAAAGELFIDDDIIPTKYLTVPSLVGSTRSNNDDVVRQLDELKSLKTDTLPAGNPAPELASVEMSTQQTSGTFNGVHRLLANNK